MANLVAAFGSSHSIMLTAELADWTSNFVARDRDLPLYNKDGTPCTYEDHLARAPSELATTLLALPAITKRFEDTQAAMRRMKEEISAANLDVLVIVGDDQYELFQDEHMPAIAVYYGASIRNASRDEEPDGGWYRRARKKRLEDGGEVHYPCNDELALHFIHGLLDRDFDVSTLKGLRPSQYEGHAYSFVHRCYMEKTPLPIVPIMLNTYNPPNQPRPERCLALGEALAALIESFPQDIRVGVFASGGLSHFLVEEEMDRGIIEAIQNKDMKFLGDLDPLRLQAGSSEIRNWIVVARAALKLDLSWVSYVPAYRTPALTGTGLCFAKWS